MLLSNTSTCLQMSVTFLETVLIYKPGARNSKRKGEFGPRPIKVRNPLDYSVNTVQTL
jgi:hypothetical protein